MALIGVYLSAQLNRERLGDYGVVPGISGKKPSQASPKTGSSQLILLNCAAGEDS